MRHIEMRPICAVETDIYMTRQGRYCLKSVHGDRTYGKNLRDACASYRSYLNYILFTKLDI